MTKKKEKDNKIIISIIAVAMIIALVGGGTYAWFRWVSANNTVVNITVAGGKYTLDGGGDITTDKTMVATDECNHSTYAIKRTITANTTNSTSTAMTAKIQLNPTTFPTQLKISELKWVLTTSSTSCTSGIVDSGDFSTVAENTIFELTSFTVPAETTTTQTNTYYLYIWLDSSYDSLNTGTTVSDPIQNKTFTLELTGEMSNNPSA